MIDRFHHAFIAAVDFERSLAFYRDTLGWSVTRSWGEAGGGDRGAILSGGAMKVVIVQKPSDGGLHPAVHLDIHDIDKRFAAMPKGEHVVAEPQDTPWGTRWFVVRDPDGNEIAFEEVHLRGR
jgi:catechol 2,3-dioxygenase-like lactoylglutathione lyase family enzyme